MLRSLLAPSIGQLAENAWRSSNREQLHAVALRAAEIDPEKALAAATLLAFAAGGKEPEVPTLRPGSLGWLFVASLRDLQAFGPAAVGVSPSAARALWVGLSEALEAHDKASQGRSDRA
jgi:hypothetical protein